jgi:hypothetical protein
MISSVIVLESLGGTGAGIGFSCSGELGGGVTGRNWGRVTICVRGRWASPSEEEDGEGKAWRGKGEGRSSGSISECSTSNSVNDDSGDPRLALCEQEVSGDSGLSISIE